MKGTASISIGSLISVIVLGLVSFYFVTGCSAEEEPKVERPTNTIEFPDNYYNVITLCDKYNNRLYQTEDGAIAVSPQDPSCFPNKPTTSPSPR